MRPGDVVSGDVTITNTGDLAGAFRLTSSIVTEQPGAGGGQLRDRLVLQVLDITNPGAVLTLWTGSLGGFTGRDLGTFEARQGHTYRISVTFPDAGPGGDNAFAGASTSVRFDWTGVADEPAAVGAAGQCTPKTPAKIRVLRAGVTGGVLDMLVEMTGRAAVPGAKLALSYRSSGRTTKFSVPVPSVARASGLNSIKIRKPLPAAQRSKNTGIVDLTYAGSDTVQPDSVRLRAATGKSLLRRATTKIQNGRLIVSGTITSKARGVVRIRLGYDKPDCTSAFLSKNATISNGTWKLNQQLPADAAKGGQLSIQFTGYEPRNLRGEQTGKQVNN